LSKRTSTPLFLAAPFSFFFDLFDGLTERPAFSPPLDRIDLPALSDPPPSRFRLSPPIFCPRPARSSILFPSRAGFFNKEVRGTPSRPGNLLHRHPPRSHSVSKAGARAVPFTSPPRLFIRFTPQFFLISSPFAADRVWTCFRTGDQNIPFSFFERRPFPPSLLHQDFLFYSFQKELRRVSVLPSPLLDPLFGL